MSRQRAALEPGRLGTNSFKRFWASTISNLGDGIGVIAYPWLGRAEMEELGVGIGDRVEVTDDLSLSDGSTAVADRTSPAFWFARPDRAGVRSLRDVGQLASVLLGLLGLMASAALVHRLVMSSRAARRERAVLRSLGFTGRQFGRSGAAQGATVSLLALVGAIPLGLLFAAVGWRWVAEYLRVVPSPAAPVAVVTGIAVFAMALAIAAGIALSRHARHARPGVVLRTE